jgi:hypothetical protein
MHYKGHNPNHHVASVVGTHTKEAVEAALGFGDSDNEHHHAPHHAHHESHGTGIVAVDKAVAHKQKKDAKVVVKKAAVESAAKKAQDK